MKAVVYLILFVTFSLRSNAQRIVCGMSPLGATIHLEGKTTEPVLLQKNGKDFAKIQLQTSESEIKKELAKTKSMLPDYPVMHDSLLHYTLESLRKANETNGIYGVQYLPVKAALGLAVFDKQGQPSDVYTASVNGVSIPVSWERKETTFIEPALSGRRYRSWYGNIESSWNINPANKLLFTKLFRKSHDSLMFRPVKEATYMMSRKGDTLTVLARDTTQTTLSYFQYSMVGYDFYGNASNPSLPLTADNLDNSTLPVVLGFSAKENAQSKLVEVRWKVKFHQRVKSLVLQRSIYRDKGFETIAQLQPTDSIYRDVAVNPMEAIYYRLLIYDLKGLLDHTPVVPMVSKSKPDVMPPTLVTCSMKGNYPEIQWTISDRSARGFKVYRTRVIGEEPELVSAFIEADRNTQYRWIDSSKALTPGQSFHYAIRGQGKGYTESEFSDFVSIQLPDDRSPEVPQGVFARLMGENQVLVVWNTQGEFSDNARAFRVYRSEQQNGQYKPLHEVPVFMENSFTDTLNEIGSTFYYRVSSISPQGKESAQSLPVMVNRGKMRQAIPDLLVKNTESGTLIIWPESAAMAEKIEIQYQDEEGKTGSLGAFPIQQKETIDTSRKTNETRGYRAITIFTDGSRIESANWTFIAE